MSPWRSLAAAFVILTLASTLSCSEDSPNEPASVRVDGNVLDREGEPVPSAFVTFYPREDTPGGSQIVEPEASVKTDAVGAFQAQVPGGTYDVTVEPPILTGLPGRALKTTVQLVRDTRLDLQFSGVKVSGEIHVPDGYTGSGSVFVTAFSPSTLVRADDLSTDGTYSVLLPAGPYRFLVRPEGNDTGLPELDREVNIAAASDTTLDLDLTGSEISVWTTLNGTPLSPGGASAEGNGIRAHARNDVAGKATLYLPAGDYVLSLGGDAMEIAYPESYPLPVTGAASHTFDVQRVRWEITFRRTADGEPIHGVYLDAQEVGGFSHAAAAFDAPIWVAPNRPYELEIIPPSSTPPYFPSYEAEGTYSSAADSIFDVYVDVPVPAAGTILTPRSGTP